MNASTPLGLPVRHRTRLVAPVAALAASLVLLAASAACSGISTGTGASTHACADKVAKAVTTGKNVPGMWNCLSPDFQKTLNAYGLSGDNAFASNLPPMVLAYVGSHGDVVLYHVIIPGSGGNPAQSLVLMVWVDLGTGLVSNVGIGRPAF